MAMGFSQAESEAALIAVNNASVDLALDKVFELKALSEEQQDSKLQSIIEKSLSNLSNPPKDEKSIEEEKLKKEEEEKYQEKQKRIEESLKLKEEISAQKAVILSEMQEEESRLKRLRDIEILGWAMVTNMEKQSDVAIIACIMKGQDGVNLVTKTISYYPEYLRKLFKKNKDSETSLLDSYEVLSSDPQSEEPSEEAIGHALEH